MSDESKRRLRRPELPLSRRRFLELSIGAGVARQVRLPRGFGCGASRGSYVSLGTMASSELPLLLQSPWPALAVLGDDSRSDPLDRGNHLRWAFPPAPGFPDGGFDLYRHAHVEPSPDCIADWPMAGRANLGRHVVLGATLLRCDAELSTLAVGSLGGAIGDPCHSIRGDRTAGDGT